MLQFLKKFKNKTKEPIQPNSSYLQNGYIIGTYYWWKKGRPGYRQQSQTEGEQAQHTISKKNTIQQLRLAGLGGINVELRQNNNFYLHWLTFFFRLRKIDSWTLYWEMILQSTYYYEMKSLSLQWRLRCLFIESTRILQNSGLEEFCLHLMPYSEDRYVMTSSDAIQFQAFSCAVSPALEGIISCYIGIVYCLFDVQVTHYVIMHFVFVFSSTFA